MERETSSAGGRRAIRIQCRADFRSYSGRAALSLIVTAAIVAMLLWRDYAWSSSWVLAIVLGGIAVAGHDLWRDLRQPTRVVVNRERSRGFDELVAALRRGGVLDD